MQIVKGSELHERLIAVLDEAVSLNTTALPGDPFLRDIIAFITRIIGAGWRLTGDDLTKLRLMGQAAVRTYQTFDEVEPAERFVDLACGLSKSIHDVNVDD